MRDLPDFDEVIQRLRRERPVPDPMFRGDLRRRIVKRGASPTGRRSLLAAAYAATGLMMMLVAAIGVAGVGPFAS